MYYHGSKKSEECPFAGKGYTFWLYPLSRQVYNKWDTHCPAYAYCSNYKDEGPSPVDKVLRQFTCLGHTSMDEFKVAQAEWTMNGWTTDVTYEPPHEEDTNSLPSHPPMAPLTDPFLTQEEQKSQASSLTDTPTLDMIEERVVRLENILQAEKQIKNTTGSVNLSLLLLLLSPFIYYLIICLIPSKDIVISSRDLRTEL